MGKPANNGGITNVHYRARLEFIVIICYEDILPLNKCRGFKVLGEIRTFFLSLEGCVKKTVDGNGGNLLDAIASHSQLHVERV